MDDLERVADAVDRMLAEVDARLAADYPGEAASRQPVHTVYIPADRYSRSVAAEWGAAAVALLDAFAPTAADVAQVWGLDVGHAAAVRDRVVRKLVTEPIEDLRLDLEDGYGTRSDVEEDADARRAGRELAATAADHPWSTVITGSEPAGPVIGGAEPTAAPRAVPRSETAIRCAAPPFTGVRFRSLEAPTRRRGLRTLQLVVEELVAAGGVPAGFVFTLPKVTAVEQVSALVTLLDGLERAHGLRAGALRFEIQVETPQSVLATDGTSPLPCMIAAAAGRCTGLHYGTYDYSAALGIAAAYQSIEHPVADHAKAVMQVAVAGTGVRLSDGSTNVLPVGDRAAVHAAWRLHGRLVRRSLERGFYQGWDLHPGQLPSRYVACYAFYREGFEQAAARLRAYVERADSGFLDEPATAVALAGFLLRGLECGALDDAEVMGAADADRPRLAMLARHTLAR